MVEDVLPLPSPEPPSKRAVAALRREKGATGQGIKGTASPGQGCLAAWPSKLPPSVWSCVFCNCGSARTSLCLGRHNSRPPSWSLAAQRGHAGHSDLPRYKGSNALRRRWTCADGQPVSCETKVLAKVPSALPGV